MSNMSAEFTAIMKHINSELKNSALTEQEKKATLTPPTRPRLTAVLYQTFFSDCARMVLTKPSGLPFRHTARMPKH